MAARVRQPGQPPAPLPPIALYVHVPFCLSLCPYCDFVVYAGRAARGPGARTEPYVEAVLAEIDLRADERDAAFGAPGGRRAGLGSVYLGGGTPSLLPAASIARLLERIARRFGIDTGAEITLEANPGPDDRGDLAGFRAAGVTRLSLGAQSMDPHELRRLGRRHAPDDVSSAVDTARRAGFRSISVDLLYDVPGQTEESWARSLRRTLDLPIDHVSAYALALDDPGAEGLTGALGDHLDATPGARRWRDRARGGQDQDRAAAMYEAADRLLREAGFAWYELSNWSHPGHESCHNLAYWRSRPWEAVGPGAHAYDGARERRWNAASLDGYLAALTPADGAAPALPPGGRELLDSDVHGVERLILALRLREGITVPRVRVEPWTAARLAVIDWAVGSGLAAHDAGRVRLTLRGRLLANEVFSRLL